MKTVTNTILSSNLFDAVAPYLAYSSPWRGLILSLSVLILCLWIRRVLRRSLVQFLAARSFRPANAATFLRLHDGLWMGVIGILFLIAASGSFAVLGLSIGFLGTILGWSLQAPIRGLAAWVMVVLRKPFRLGDRITVAGVTGDVVDIQLNHIVLNQVGGTVVGEELSGRGIFVPTAMLFSEEIINCNLFGHVENTGGGPSSKTILDEVCVRVTFDSDYDLSCRICLAAAREALEEVLGAPVEAPFTRAEFLPSGMMIRVRYKTIAAKRQETSSCITERIWAAINKHHPAVKFRYPVNVTGLVAESGSRGSRIHPLVPGGTGAARGPSTGPT